MSSGPFCGSGEMRANGAHPLPQLLLMDGAITSSGDDTDPEALIVRRDRGLAYDWPEAFRNSAFQAADGYQVGGVFPGECRLRGEDLNRGM